MSEEKRKETPIRPKTGEEAGRSDVASSRARNRTVLLTPEVAGQVRALLAKEEGKEPSDAVNDLISPGWDNPQGMSQVTERPTSSWSTDAIPSERGRMRTPTYHGPHHPTDPQQWRGRGLDNTPQRSGTIDPYGKRAPTMDQALSTPGNFNAVNPMPQGVVQRNPIAGGPISNPGYPVSAPAPQNFPPQESQPAVVRERARGTTGTFQLTAPSKLVGFLIAYDNNVNGEVVELRIGRWLLTSRPSEHGDHILVSDESISPLHAIIRVSKEGKVQVLDQLSEFGTGIVSVQGTSEEEVTGSMVVLHHGDIVRFGKRRFVVCLIPERVDLTEIVSKTEG